MMNIVRENLYEFQRGQEPKKTLELGGEYEKIKKWLSRFLYKPQWKLNDDWTIDIIRGDFILSSDNVIRELPEFIQFNKTIRDFIFVSSNLEIMNGFPKIVNGDFAVSQNNIQSLAGCPELVGGDFNIKYNKILFTEEQIREVCDVKGKIYL